MTIHKFAIMAVLIGTAASVAGSSTASPTPGYHINTKESCNRALKDFGDKPALFDACVYQSVLDKGVAQLALSSLQFWKEKPEDPKREYCFVASYWEYQNTLVQKSPTPSELDEPLKKCYEAACRASLEIAKKMPNSAQAQFGYAHFLYRYSFDVAKQDAMFAAYRKAIALEPRCGLYHAEYGVVLTCRDRTKEGYRISAAEMLKGLELDPRQDYAYEGLAANSANKPNPDYVKARYYLKLYLKNHDPKGYGIPEFVKFLDKKLGPDNSVTPTSLWQTRNS